MQVFNPIKPLEPTRGKPKNPYSANEVRWKPRATLNCFNEWPDIDPDTPPPPPASAQADVREHVDILLMALEVPVLRRVLEAILVVDHGFEPSAVTKALDSIRDHPNPDHYIFVSKFKCGSDRENHLYSYEKPTKAELKYLREAYRKRQHALSNAVLRRAGEHYFRAVLKQSKKYRGITQLKQLGSVTDRNGKHALDMVATSKKAGTTYGISIKNQREWLFPGNKAIADSYTKAKAHGVKPWLVVAFATDAARRRCEKDGIRLTVLGRQIMPAEDQYHRPMRVVIDSLRSVLGPQPFDYAYKRASETFRRSSMARADVKAIREEAR